MIIHLRPPWPERRSGLFVAPALHLSNPLRIGRPISFGCIAAKKICDVPLITNIRLIFMLPKVDIIWKFHSPVVRHILYGRKTAVTKSPQFQDVLIWRRQKYYWRFATRLKILMMTNEQGILHISLMIWAYRTCLYTPGRTGVMLIFLKVFNVC